jgi:hypothetical protein
LERHQRGEAGLHLLELLQAVGALPVARCQLLRRAGLLVGEGLRQGNAAAHRLGPTPGCGAGPN